MAEKILKNNKYAGFKFLTSDSFEAGIVLNGTDVKDIKKGKFEIRDAFLHIEKGEVFLMNLILESNPAASKRRKLLLNKKEIAKISELLANKKNRGYVVRVKYNDKSFVKIDIGIGITKKQFDKKASQKRMTEKRSVERELKEGLI